MATHAPFELENKLVDAMRNLIKTYKAVFESVQDTLSHQHSTQPVETPTFKPGAR